MGKIIVSIPVDSEGNLLFLKEFKEENNKFFIKYKTNLNDMPFQSTEIYLVDNNQNFAITADNGTIMYRWHVAWISKFLDKPEQPEKIRE